MSLRHELRQCRKNLPSNYRDSAIKAIAQQVLSFKEFTHAQLIAGYSPFDGEVDALPLLALALQQGKRCFLPRIHRDATQSSMEFVEFHSMSALTPNQFGILEPNSPHDEIIAPEKLDLVFTPLVGFDKNAHRLGMGRGYYDRCFHFLHKTQQRMSIPFLIGLAFDCQFVASFPLHENDISLHAVVTESKVFFSKK